MASNNVSRKQNAYSQGNEGLLDETHTTKYGVTKIYNFMLNLFCLLCTIDFYLAIQLWNIYETINVFVPNSASSTLYLSSDQ